MLHIIVWNNKVQNGLIFRIAHIHTDILLGDVHGPGGDAELGGADRWCPQTHRWRRPSITQVPGSSGPHRSLRLLEKPPEGTELLHGSQSPYPCEDSVGGHRGHSKGPCCCWEMPADTSPAAPPPQSPCPSVLTAC